MASRAKSTETLEGHRTKEELEDRTEMEAQLRGEVDELEPPHYLTPEQVQLFRELEGLLKDTGLIGKADSYIVATGAVAIERMRWIESLINKTPDLMLNQKLMAANDKYTKNFFRVCTELCLSPAARAKLASAATAKRKDEKDPLMEVLSG